MICNAHKENRENIELLEAYKTKYITFSGNTHQEFSRNIGIYHVDSGHVVTNDDDIEEMAIYALQTNELREIFTIHFLIMGVATLCLRKRLLIF